MTVQKTEQNDTDFQKKENQPSAKDLNRLKNAWEHLQKFQDETLRRIRKGPIGQQISSVNIVTDGNGKKTVQINLLNGKKIMDTGDCRRIFKKMIPKKRVNIGKVISLLDAVRQYGFAAVAAGLSPAMRALLFKVCKKCGVPLRVKQKQSSRKADEPTRLKRIPKEPRNPVKNNTVTYSTEIRSLFKLQEAIRQQKKENNDRLKRVLQNDHEKASEKYFDRLRAELTEIEYSRKNGFPLTQEQEKTKELADRFGLKANKKYEYPTDLQKEKRRALPPQDLPKDIQTELNNENKRHKAICLSKNNAANLIFARHSQNFKTERSAGLSSESLIREVCALLPPLDQRDMKNMKSTLEKIKRQTFVQNEKSKRIRAEKKNRFSNLMAKTMNGDAPKKTAPQQAVQSEKPLRTIQRKSFLSNAVIMQELKNVRLTER